MSRSKPADAEMIGAVKQVDGERVEDVCGRLAPASAPKPGSWRRGRDRLVADIYFSPLPSALWRTLAAAMQSATVL
jgi:hypothetical protein